MKDSDETNYKCVCGGTLIFSQSGFYCDQCNYSGYLKQSEDPVASNTGKELKRCLYCGMRTGKVDDPNYVDFGCDCVMTDADATSIFVEVNTWQNAWAHKRIAELEYELKLTTKQCLYFQEKVEELENGN